MYSYLYNEKLSLSGYHRAVAAIETRLHDLDIQGKICRLTPMKNPRELVEQEFHRGVKTLVVVGDDVFVERIVTIIATQGWDMILGIIPVGSGTHDIAKSLSIPLGIDACNILSYRMVRTLRIGRVNSRFFLTSVQCTGMLTVDCGGLFRVSSPHNKPISVVVTNNPYEESTVGRGIPALKLRVISHHAKGLLARSKVEESLFVSHRFSIDARDRLTVTIDDHQVTTTPPITIESSSIKLKMITGALRPSVRATLNARPPINRQPDTQEYGW